MILSSMKADGVKMAVTTSELKEIMETITDSTVKAEIHSAISDLGNFTNSTPSYTGASNLQNVSLAKSTPKNGIITFTFDSDYGITVTVSYRG